MNKYRIEERIVVEGYVEVYATSGYEAETEYAKKRPELVFTETMRSNKHSIVEGESNVESE